MMKVLLRVSLFLWAISSCSIWAEDHGLQLEFLPKDWLQRVDAGTPSHHRTKRQIAGARKPIRITPVYATDSLTQEKTTILESLVNDMVQYFSDRYSVTPTTKPLLLFRHCMNVYPTLSNSTTRACDVECAATTSCGALDVPAKYLRACTVCDGAGACTVGTDQQGEGAGQSNSDLLIFVTVKATSPCTGNSATLGHAMHCALESTLDRPVIGSLNICPNHLVANEIERDALIGLMRHEVYHILGMNSNLFAYFRDDLGMPRTVRGTDGDPNLPDRYITDTGLGFSYTANTVFRWSDTTVVQRTLSDWATVSGATSLTTHVMVTPKVREFVRQHFNCPTLEGAFLENEGNSASALNHWEKRIFGNEVMSPVVTLQYAHSGLTMAMMEDSGWYTSNMLLADPLLYGKGLGCDFAMKSCRTWFQTRTAANKSTEPYCNTLKTFPRRYGCDLERREKTVCSINEHDADLPAKGQYFDSMVPVVPAPQGSLARYGSNTGTFSDYCPTENKYKSGDKNSICGLEGNARSPAANLAMEYYGPQSRCINQGRSWVRGDHTLSSYGSGCYKTYCIAPNEVHIDVGGQRTDCTGRANKEVMLSFRVSGKQYHGSIICPSYADVCYRPSLVTTALPSAIQCANGIDCSDTGGGGAGSSAAAVSFCKLTVLLALLVGKMFCSSLELVAY